MSVFHLIAAAAAATAPATVDAVDDVDASDVAYRTEQYRKQRCTVPTEVIPPFNNSPGAIAQSEAATRIVLSTREGRAAYPEVDPDRPVCSTFGLDAMRGDDARDNAGSVDEGNEASGDGDIGVGEDLGNTAGVAEQAI